MEENLVIEFWRLSFTGFYAYWITPQLPDLRRKASAGTMAT